MERTSWLCSAHSSFIKGKNRAQTSAAAGAVASAPRLWRYWGSLQPGVSAAAAGLENRARPHQPREDKGGIALAWFTGWRCLLGFWSALVLGLTFPKRNNWHEISPCGKSSLWTLQCFI